MSADPEYERARSTAVTYLGLNRSKPSGRIRSRLRQEGFADELSDRVIADLIAIDYLDDRLVARRILHRHGGRRGKSRACLQELLVAQGVPYGVARELLEEGPGDRERALALIDSLFPQGGSREAIYKRLVSRGFAPDLAAGLAAQKAR